MNQTHAIVAVIVLIALVWYWKRAKAGFDYCAPCAKLASVYPPCQAVFPTRESRLEEVGPFTADSMNMKTLVFEDPITLDNRVHEPRSLTTFDGQQLFN